MSKDNGGPAFPTDTEHQPANHIMHLEGMTLRDYFAAKAMNAEIQLNGENFTYEEIARRSYLQADAMLKSRNQGEMV